MSHTNPFDALREVMDRGAERARLLDAWGAADTAFMRSGDRFFAAGQAHLLALGMFLIAATCDVPRWVVGVHVALVTTLAVVVVGRARVFVRAYKASKTAQAAYDASRRGAS